MIPTLGHLCLIIALAASLAGSAPLLRPSLIHHASWRGMVRAASRVSFVMIALAFVLLTTSFVHSDFSVALVYQHSHTLKPLLYKVAGVWGNHEGSLLLWLVVLSACGTADSNSNVHRPPSTVHSSARFHTIINALVFLFLCLSIFTSNPFETLFPVPLDGQDLNPLLQDPGLAFHPPLLYIGYVGMALVFATACVVLWEGAFTAAHARTLRLCTLFAWGFLTAGLALGSWWAYYELGWGGWWFWDPVENAALMPWLVGAALLHSLRVAEVKQQMLRWCLLLAIMSFALSMLGTFLVRSGILTSVHSFASDPLRGMAILGIFALITGAALTMLAIRWPQFSSQQYSSSFSREGMLMLNNIFLSVAAATVFIGTLYPLFIQALGRPEITVGPPYYNATFVPLMLPLLAVLALGQGMAWGIKRQEDKKPRSQEKIILVMVLAIVAGAVFVLLPSWSFVFLASWLLGSTVFLSTVLAWRRMKISQLIAHIGLGICVMGMAGTALGTEHMVQVKPGDRFIFAGYAIHYEKPFERTGKNYVEGGVVMQVDGVGAMMPARRYFPVADSWTTEAAIHTTLLGDLFMTVGIPDEQKAVAMRIRFQPLQVWIWMGAGLIMLGGLVGAVQVMRKK